ncbi:MAG TPA: N-acetylmuramoyl-L-alanine amidase [Gemmatimonadaceae bacterium]|nr:N-acetylmuramoyl-L-alanine amidase [Gemmatimonadaceae bacterium]
MMPARVARLVVGALVAALVITAPLGAQAARRPAPRHRTVIVDAGHGGVDRGMTGYTSSGRRIYEKDITLDIANRVASRLENAGVHVVMTRTADTLIGLYDRGPIANRADGDLFISIHVNAANPHWKDPSSARGFETYFLAEARTEDERRVAEMENASVQFDAGPEMPTHDNALGFMLNDMLQNEHLRESSDLAATIQGDLQAVHPGPSRGVKQGNLVVLIKAFMPAVLVEVGFGSNPADADWMTSARGQGQIADAISKAALSYLARYERRVAGGSSGK